MSERQGCREIGQLDDANCGAVSVFSCLARDRNRADFRWHRMKARIAGILLGAASLVCWGTPVLALPGEWAAGGEIGLGRSTRSTWSPSLGLRGTYGLAEAFDLQLEVSGQWLRIERSPVETNDALLRLVPALSYRLDVLRWIPFVRVGAGPTLALPLEGDATSRIVLAVQGALGAEYLVDRSLSLGLAYQADWGVGASALASRLAPMHRLLFTVMWRSGW